MVEHMRSYADQLRQEVLLNIERLQASGPLHDLHAAAAAARWGTCQPNVHDALGSTSGYLACVGVCGAPLCLLATVLLGAAAIDTPVLLLLPPLHRRASCDVSFVLPSLPSASCTGRPD